MDNKAVMLLSQWWNFIPAGSGLMLQSHLEKLDDSKIPLLTTIALRNPAVGLILGVFLGIFGADRFYKGDIGLGILKFLLSIILIGFTWVIIDWFLVWRGIKQDNLRKISQQLMRCYSGT